MGNIKIPIQLPLDNDGFLRRECPNCEQEFKWLPTGDGGTRAEQYFCPRCGMPAGVDRWWTPAQIEYVRGLSGPAMDQYVNDALDDAFDSNRNRKSVTFKRTGDFSFNIPTPEPLIEPDDMVIVEPPCHPNEPIKVPEGAVGHIYCLICGAEFTV
jgi:ribosomal protein S27AE